MEKCLHCGKTLKSERKADQPETKIKVEPESVEEKTIIGEGQDRLCRVPGVPEMEDRKEQITDAF